MAYYFAIQLMMNAVGRVSLSEKANSLYTCFGEIIVLYTYGRKRQTTLSFLGAVKRATKTCNLFCKISAKRVQASQPSFGKSDRKNGQNVQVQNVGKYRNFLPKYRLFIGAKIDFIQ